MSTAALKAAVTKQEAHPVEKLKAQLVQNKVSLGQLIGPKNVDKFIQVALNAVAARPELLEAYRPSFFIACRKAAQDGLYPDGKEAVFNIYNTKVKDKAGAERWIPVVQYLPMVRGIIKLLWRSDHFTCIDAAAVYERDHFHFQRGDDPRIEHEPYPGDEDPGKVVAAYMIAKLKNGEVKREVMFRRDIEAAHRQSQPYKNAQRYKQDETGPWVDWYDQMAIKSVVHRGYKQLPGVDEMDAVIERSIGADMGQDLGDFIEIPDYPAIEGSATPALPESAGGEAPPTQAAQRREPVEAGGPPPTEEELDLAARMEQVDRDTGEIRGGNGPAAAAAASAGGGRTDAAQKSASAPGASGEAGGPIFGDALRLVSEGEFDLARDLGSSLGRLPDVEAAISAEKAKRARAKGGGR